MTTVSPTGWVKVDAEEREAMHRHLGGGFHGYLTRMRDAHWPCFGPGRIQPLVYRGCSCGEVLCSVPLLLLHIEDLREAYEMKVNDLARETLRRDCTHPDCNCYAPCPSLEARDPHASGQDQP